MFSADFIILTNSLCNFIFSISASSTVINNCKTQLWATTKNSHNQNEQTIIDLKCQSLILQVAQCFLRRNRKTRGQGKAIFSVRIAVNTICTTVPSADIWSRNAAYLRCTSARFVPESSNYTAIYSSTCGPCIQIFAPITELWNNRSLFVFCL